VARATFRAELRSSGSGGGGHLVEVPDDVIAKLGGKGRTPVTATFDGVPYRGSIVKMRGTMMIGVTKAIMAEAGVQIGDTLTVAVENDDAPREVEVPADLAKAFRGAKDAKAEWDRLAFTHQREYAEAILDAKKPETRARRIEKTIEALVDRARGRR
jgi:antitoxin component of MazEF toxin-antitoxin module